MRGAISMLAQLTVAQKVAATAAVIVSLGSVTTYTTYAAFNDTATAQQNVDSGTVTVDLGTAATSANRLSLAANDIAAGDTMQRAVTLSNTGTIDWASATLDVAASTSSALDTDTTDGLQMVVDSCSVAWTETMTNGVPTYTCGGTTATVLASRPVVGTGLDLGSVNALTVGGTDYLRVTVSLPSTATNTLSGLSTVLDYTFTATQRAGTSK